MNFKTTFHIRDMDCPSEENLIKMKLAHFKNITALEFDLQARVLDVYHTGDHTEIQKSLESLKLNSEFVQSEKTLEKRENGANDKSLLWAVLWINLGFFFIEASMGVLYSSMGLVADGLDMLADAFVYGLSIYALHAVQEKKNLVAKLSGYLQFALAGYGLYEVIERFFSPSDLPEFRVMILVSFFALLGNSLSLYILKKSKSKDTPMQASLIFTSNDVIANIGVIVAGGLVYALDSKIPDLIIGLIVFLLVAQGAYRILSLAKS